MRPLDRRSVGSGRPYGLHNVAENSSISAKKKSDNMNVTFVLQEDAQALVQDAGTIPTAALGLAGVSILE